MKTRKKNGLINKSKNNTKLLCKHSIKKTYHGALYRHPKKPLKTYRLRVSDLHTISFTTYGNPKGKPAVYVHGGPGGGTRPSMARFFNPRKYYIVLVDQRGCGKSTPNGELRENTTQDLVNDFEKIRKKLGIKKWLICGGSWGSTLALYYAMAHPEITTELILRAIFLGTQEEVNWLNEPNGAENLNPIGWEYYSNAIPKKYKTDNFLNDYGRCFRGDFGNKKKSDCFLAWAAWEDMNLKLHMPTLEYTIHDLKTNKNEYETIAKIEHYYFTNKCFIEEDYLIKKENVDKIRHIPTKIIQGVYDIICPFKYGYLLHKAFPEAEFYPTMAGHSSYDEENVKHIVEATKDFSK